MQVSLKEFKKLCQSSHFKVSKFFKGQELKVESFEELYEVIPAGPFQGLSLLWVITLAMKGGKSKSILPIYEKLNKIPLANLKEEATSGEHKGKTFLWLLADAAVAGKSRPFAFVWQNNYQQFTIEDIRRGFKCKSVFNQVAAAAKKTSSTPFEYVWHEFKKELTFDDFQQEDDSEASALRWLAACGFPFVWDNIHAHITLKNLRQIIIAGSSKGETLLWVLARASGAYPKRFLKLWRTYHTQITLNDLLQKVQAGLNKGRSVFDALVTHSDNSAEGPLQVVWQQFRGQIIACKDVSVLYPLAKGLAKKKISEEDFIAAYRNCRKQLSLTFLCHSNESVWNSSILRYLVGCYRERAYLSCDERNIG